MKKNFKISAQGGFTLIELIVVIVILGILAATALPKFSNLGTEARTASLRAAKGAVASAAAMVRAQALVRNETATTTIEGQVVKLVNGYPDASDHTAFATAAGLNAHGSTDYVVTTAANVMTVSVAGAVTPANCRFTYTSAAAGQAPAIAEVVGGC